MESFSAAELGDSFDLEFALNWGMLPFVWNDPQYAADILAAYVNTYLKEELQAEGLIRNVPPFVRFLSIAGQINGQIVNVQNIARDAAGVTVERMFGVYCGSRSYQFDNITVLPFADFIKTLFAGEVF